MASYSDHDDHLSFSPSRTPRVCQGKNFSRFCKWDDQFAQDHVNQLVGEAENLQAKRNYTAAFTRLGQVLSLQLFHSGLFFFFKDPCAHETIERIIALLFHQYQLAREPEAMSTSAELELAFTKLPIDTSDLNTLLAVRAVADWCRRYKVDLAHSLYARLHTRMEQVIGPQHPETFRLLYHWAKCGYPQRPDMSSDPLNFRELEEKFQAALPELDKVLGRHDPDTINCTHTLGNIYLEQEKYSEAQATFERLYRGQVTEFGDADDRTLLSLSDLAKAFAYSGNHVQAGKLIWSALVENIHLDRESWILDEGRLHQSEGKSAYLHQNEQLARRKAPRFFFWESKALYCLPIRHLEFQAIYPSVHENRLLWHKYTYEVEDDEFIHLTVPYIPYSHFSTSRDFSGFTYQYYTTKSDLKSREKHKLMSHNGDLQSVWHPFGEKTTSPETGFFNDIPGDTAVMIYDNAADIGFNLVSSDWVDYNSFTLHTTAKALTPELKNADGSTITCRGYISGTWTSFDAERKWNGLMVFVVDAVFSESAGSNRIHHFLLSPALLQRASQNDLSSDDKRSLAASLNPTLLRTSILHVPACGVAVRSQYPRSYPDLHTPVQKEYMDEMNRRQKWDRSFENERFSSGETTELQKEKEEEDRRRMEWDQEWVEQPVTDGSQPLQPLQPPPPSASWNPFSRLKQLKVRK